VQQKQRKIEIRTVQKTNKIMTKTQQTADNGAIKKTKEKKKRISGGIYK